jgi:hypothetical protein
VTITLSGKPLRLEYARSCVSTSRGILNVAGTNGSPTGIAWLSARAPCRYRYACRSEMPRSRANMAAASAALLPRDNRPCAAFKFSAFCVFVDHLLRKGSYDTALRCTARALLASCQSSSSFAPAF